MKNGPTLPRAVWVRGGLFLLAFTALNFAAAKGRQALIDAHLADLMVLGSMRIPGAPVRYDLSVGEDPNKFWNSIPDARTQRLAILVGMSQMFAINDVQYGDLTVPERLDDLLAPHGVRVFGLTAPNLDNEEALLYLLATAIESQHKPFAMIYGVCFDKMRNLDVRPKLLQFMEQRPELQSAWKEAAMRYREPFPRASEKMLGTLQSLHEQETADATADESFETRLRNTVAEYVPLVEGRREINAYIYGHLYFLRNFIFNIKTSTKRPIIGARYDLNRELLEIIAEEAARRNIKLLSYVIPLNPRADSPYVDSEYRGFKTWFADFTTRHGSHYVNLEDIVPAGDWGLLNGEPDFKHFTARGHNRTANAVYAAFRDDLLSGPTASSR